MKADDLYNALVGNAWKLAAQSTLGVDDIRQELYLLCMEVAEGRSKYTPLIGGVHEYIMGRLWGLVRRWPQSQSLDDLIENDVVGEDWATRYKPATWDRLLALHAPSVEETLVQRDERLEQDARDIEETLLKRERTRDQSALAILIQSGHWSLREAAKFCGTNHSKIKRYMDSILASKQPVKEPEL